MEVDNVVAWLVSSDKAPPDVPAWMSLTTLPQAFYESK